MITLLPAVVGFVTLSVIVRGGAIAAVGLINPDEVELMAQARAALRSPVPFTTWTMGTTGPTWPLTLALLGALGLPLTIAAAHVLSAVLTGLLGAGIFLLLRRAFSLTWSLVITIAWWAPLALVVPLLGYPSDFVALSTEYLPGALVVLIALFGLRSGGGRSGWLVAGGVLGILAVGAKFQIAPLVFMVLLIVVVRERRGFADRLRGIGWVALGAVVPLALLVIVLLVAPGVTDALVAQQFGFLGSYAEGTDLATRLQNTFNVLLSARWYLLPFATAIVWLSIRSDGATALARLAITGSGLVAVLAGGRGLGHYLIILIVAVGIAIALPLRERRPPVPGRWALPVFATLTLLAVGAVATFGFGSGRITPVRPTDLAVALSPDSAPTIAELTRLCPPGSGAVVWGWAPELYLSQAWTNEIPYFNILGLMIDGAVHDAAEPIILDGLERADCVIEALGQPYFAIGPESTLEAVYPVSADVLEESFRLVPGVLEDCEGCNVYVRR